MRVNEKNIKVVAVWEDVTIIHVIELNRFYVGK